MEGNHNTIGFQDLLDEVSRDIDEFRKKHPNDYGVRNVTMWWELERERLVTRHVPGSVIRTLRRVRSMRRLFAWFTAGWLAMFAVQTALRVLFG